MRHCALTASAPRSFELTRRRVYILPTRHGVAFAAAVTVMLFGSINYSNSLGYLLTFLLASVAVVSLLHAYRNLAGLSIRLGDPEATVAGGALGIPVTIDNRSRPERFAVALTAPGSLEPGAPACTAFVAVAADSIHNHRLPVTAPRRGVHELSGLVVASRFPLGLFRAWTPLPPGGGGGAVRCVVYPAPRGRRELPLTGTGAAGSGGTKGDGRDDFAGLRDYRRGDPAKHVHWKALARGRGMQVKEFTGPRGAAVDLDWRDTAFLGEREARLSQLACWIDEAEARSLRYGLRLPDRTIPAGSGPRHRRRLLEALAEFPGAPRPRSGRGA